MKVLGSTWFTPMGQQTIGIVIVDTGYETKAYIGTGQGLSQEEDELYLAKIGAQFPLESAKQMIGI